jgi:amino acid transporter
LDKNLKHGIALAVIAVLMGIFAGILVIAVDLSLLLDNWLSIFGVLAVIGVLLMFIAYKRGRIPIRE